MDITNCDIQCKRFKITNCDLEDRIKFFDITNRDFKRNCLYLNVLQIPDY